MSCSVMVEVFLDLPLLECLKTTFQCMKLFFFNLVQPAVANILSSLTLRYLSNQHPKDRGRQPGLPQTPRQRAHQL